MRTLNTLLTYHQTTSTIFAVIGIVVLVLVAVMSVTVLLRKKFTKPRPPGEWCRTELFIVSMFLNAWYRWAKDPHSIAVFDDHDELDVAFDKYVKELLHTGAIDRHWHGEDLMQELFLYAGLKSSQPFGLDMDSRRHNEKRVQFAKQYADLMRNLFIDAK